MTYQKDLTTMLDGIAKRHGCHVGSIPKGMATMLDDMTKDTVLYIVFFFYKVPIFASYIYDATRLYALGVNRTINNGSDYSNGRKVAERLLNRKYRSKLNNEFLSLVNNSHVVKYISHSNRGN